MFPRLSSYVVRGGLLFALFFVLSFLQTTSTWIHPNIFLVAIIALALFIDHAGVFLVFLCLVVWWFSYTPFLRVEYIALFGIGVIAFFLSRFFVLHKTLPIVLSFIAVFGLVFWAIVYGVGPIFSFPFLIELLYNEALGILFFVFGLWLEKKFS